MVRVKYNIVLEGLEGMLGKHLVFQAGEWQGDCIGAACKTSWAAQPQTTGKPGAVSLGEGVGKRAAQKPRGGSRMESQMRGESIGDEFADWGGLQGQAK